MNRVFWNNKDNLDKSTRKTCSNTNLIPKKWWKKRQEIELTH